MHFLKRYLGRHPTGSRYFLHTLLPTTVLGVVAAASAGSAPWFIAVIWFLCYLIAALVLELLLRQPQDELVRRVVSGPDAEAVYRSLASVEEMIACSHRVELLAGTLKTFTERSANIKALHERHRAGAHVRLLVMAPRGEGVRIANAERGDRVNQVDAEDLSDEITRSINRLLLEFSRAELREILRLYTGSPHLAMTRYDDQYIMTMYTHGRGGSSPSLAIRRGGPHEAFCEALDRGFQELWEAPSTTTLDRHDEPVRVEPGRHS